jgi:hypothetical protein
MWGKSKLPQIREAPRHCEKRRAVLTESSEPCLAETAASEDDLSGDPLETRNLAEGQKYASMRKDLMAQLRRYRAELGEVLCWSVPCEIRQIS